MARITRHARARGLTVGWDLAHAVGNVELALHDWGVDFAVWCTYKYLNAGPGAIAGAFVHERHHHHSDGHGHGHGFPRRLAGWYGADKRVRFDMDPCWARFRPAPGAHAWQVSNPSAADLAALTAALAVFADAGGMPPLRDKALVLTAYLEALLRRLCLAASSSSSSSSPSSAVSFRIVTPENPLERGCQLSLLILPRPDDDGRLLERVSAALAERGVVCDVRKPGVVRVAPAPLYCRFEDVWLFVDAFRSALEAVASTL